MRYYRKGPCLVITALLPLLPYEAQAVKFHSYKKREPPLFTEQKVPFQMKSNGVESNIEKSGISSIKNNEWRPI